MELRLVREALREREVLLRAMPHIAWPMRFVLPLDPLMRFEKATPVSRLMSTLMPWSPAVMVFESTATNDVYLLIKLCSKATSRICNGSSKSSE